MATVEKTAEFNASVDKAFKVVADISRWPEWIPPLSNVSNLSGVGVGTTYDWEFKLGPLPAFSGTGEIVKCIPNKRFEVQTQGVPSTWLFKFSDRSDQVVISLAIEYDIPGGGVVSGLVTKQIEEGLALLKGLLES
jgi:uncharacterized membrane protein